jgi:hypothetical protein
MTRFTLILLTALAFVQSASAQEEPAPQRRTRLAIELGYYSPARESFRLNYEQSLFAGSASVPVSLGLELDRPLSAQTDLYLAIRRINHRLKSDNDVSLALMPVTLGIHYYIPKDFISLSGWTPYIGAGAEFYWTRFSSTYLATQNDPTPLAEVSTTDNFLGYGVDLGLGIEHPWGEVFSSSFGIDYDVNRLGFSDEGGLGNVGGFLFHARLAISF